MKPASVQAGRIDLHPVFHAPLFAGPIPHRRGPLPADAPAEEIALDGAAVEIDPDIGSGGLFPLSLLALGNASKFATEPSRVAMSEYESACALRALR